MRYDLFLIAMLIFSLAVFGSVAMINDFSSSYEKNLSTEEFEDVYNTMDDMRGMSESFKNKTVDADITSGLDSLTTGAYGSIRLFFNSFSIFSKITNAIGKTVGISCVSGAGGICMFLDVAFVSLSILSVFGLIYLVFKVVT